MIAFPSLLLHSHLSLPSFSPLLLLRILQPSSFPVSSLFVTCRPFPLQFQLFIFHQHDLGFHLSLLSVSRSQLADAVVTFVKASSHPFLSCGMSTVPLNGASSSFLFAPSLLPPPFLYLVSFQFHLFFVIQAYTHQVFFPSLLRKV